MALSLQQVQKQTQRLIMTPQMQQSIQLLQMNALELEQLTQAELLENPFLQLEDDRSDVDPDSYEERNGAEPEAAAERDDPFERVEAEVEAEARQPLDEVEARKLEDSDRADEDRRDRAEAADRDREDNREAPSTDDTGDSDVETKSIEDDPAQFGEIDVNWEDFNEESESYTRGASTREADSEEREFTEYTAARESLYEHLAWQLRLSTLEGNLFDAGEYLLGCMDENGYLSEGSLEEARAQFELTEDEINHVLNVLQEFEPTGVFARSPAECLLLQMKALGSYSELAEKILTDHFEPLQRKKFKDIARELGASEDEILDIYHKVSRLEPKPGRQYNTEPVQYIIPDVYVKLIDGEMLISLNEGSTGHLSVNRLYRRMLRTHKQALTKEEKAYAVEKFRGALMLIKNVEKRKSTILRVTEAIMEVQREFLEKGVEALKPLTLREVADMVGMHESTIARVTKTKYVETPQGLYPLKYFFSSSIASSKGDGEAVSSRSIKDRLAQLIEEEDPKKPLSDQKISEILKKEGYEIARRTVAKYREQLKILPAKLRRSA